MKRALYLIASSICLSLSLLPATTNAECGARNAANGLEVEDLLSLNYEELLAFDLRVTSPSRKPQRFGEVASALFVLTREDIRRSGAVHIGDVLRLVPGLNVASINNNQWAISSRGFNQGFANKLLVLVDGVVVFTPGFNGVFWEQQAFPLDDIDRIEIIRGPGAALWGSNAVNGVINIITCSSSETTGVDTSLGGGTENQLLAYGRHGAELSPETHYRVYASQRITDDSELEGGGNAHDDFQVSYGGARLDSQLTKDDLLTVKAEGFYHDGEALVRVPSVDPPFEDNDSFSGRRKQYGSNVFGRWTHSFSPTSEFQSQLSHVFERQDGAVFPMERHTFFLDLNHHIYPWERHDVVYGFGSRFYHDNIQGNFADDFEPESRSTDLYNWFIQDEIALIKERLDLILGTKIEKNVHTDWEAMPNVRLVFTPDKNNTFWSAVSRAVSTPSRTFEDVIIPLAAFPEEQTGLVALPTLFGSRELESENLLAYEFGYRTQIATSVTLDVSLFYNDYDDITSAEPGEPFVGTLRDQSVPALIIPVSFENRLDVQSYGTEFSAEFDLYDWWKLTTSYAYIALDVDRGTSADFFTEEVFIEGSTPENAAILRSAFDLPHGVELDLILRYSDNLPAHDVESYIELDLRVGIPLSEEVQLELVGRNLLADSHKEFEGQLLNPPPSEVERQAYARVKWSF